MSGFDETTLRFYAGEASAYAGVDWAGEHSRLEDFLARLAPGARILELGCGGGRDTVAMLERGFDVDATDGVPEMAGEAEARTGRPVRVMRFDELEAKEEYDGVWAHASLLHVPTAELSGIIGRVHRALRPGGWHFANFKTGQGEGRDTFGRYYNYASPDALERLYASSGWEIVSTERYAGGGYDGKPSPWFALTVRKCP